MFCLQFIYRLVHFDYLGMEHLVYTVLFIGTHPREGVKWSSFLSLFLGTKKAGTKNPTRRGTPKLILFNWRTKSQYVYKNCTFFLKLVLEYQRYFGFDLFRTGCVFLIVYGYLQPCYVMLSK